MWFLKDVTPPKSWWNNLGWFVEIFPNMVFSIFPTWNWRISVCAPRACCSRSKYSIFGRSKTKCERPQSITNLWVAEGWKFGCEKQRILWKIWLDSKGYLKNQFSHHCTYRLAISLTTLLEVALALSNPQESRLSKLLFDLCKIAWKRLLKISSNNYEVFSVKIW